MYIVRQHIPAQFLYMTITEARDNAKVVAQLGFGSTEIYKLEYVESVNTLAPIAPIETIEPTTTTTTTTTTKENT